MLSDNVRNLIDVDFPDLEVPVELRDGLITLKKQGIRLTREQEQIAGMVTTEEYEARRTKILRTPLP